MSRYAEVYASWQNDPEAFWAEVAKDISWYKLWDKVIDPYSGHYGRWFAGAECNTAYNCLDRHVEAGRGDQAALIYDSPVTGTKKTYTYSELTDEVATIAAVLTDLGVGKGDRVIIYMPMIAEAVIAMQACARIGAVHSVVFGGFAASELATRELAHQVELRRSAEDRQGVEIAIAVQVRDATDPADEDAGLVEPAGAVVAQNADRTFDQVEIPVVVEVDELQGPGEVLSLR